MQRKPLMALVAIASLSGCIGIPVAVPEPRPFLVDGRPLFEPGVTTRQDVTNELGRPAYEEDDVMVFAADREGWKWAYCIAEGVGCSRSKRGTKTFYLAVDFDSGDTVIGREIYTWRQLCRERAVCMK